MAADAAQTPPVEPYTWVRCECGVRIWRRYADRLEMMISPRGGEMRIISVPSQAAAAVRTTCEKCGRINVPTETGSLS